MKNTKSISRRRLAELEVIEQVNHCGGFSIFWITATQTRARAGDRLVKSGTIVRKRGKGFGRYPWCGYKIAKPVVKGGAE